MNFKLMMMMMMMIELVLLRETAVPIIKLEPIKIGGGFPAHT